MKKEIVYHGVTVLIMVWLNTGTVVHRITKGSEYWSNKTYLIIDRSYDIAYPNIEKEYDSTFATHTVELYMYGAVIKKRVVETRQLEKEIIEIEQEGKNNIDHYNKNDAVSILIRQGFN